MTDLLLYYTTAIFCSVYFNAVTPSYVEPVSKYLCPKSEKSIYPCKCVSQNDNGLDILCENTNLAVLSIGLSNVASLRNVAVITDITIRHCRIFRLYGDLFYSLNAKRLKLEDMPLADLDSDLFLGLGKSLKELYVHSDNRSNVTSLAFAKWLTDLSVLSIDKHRMIKLSTDTVESIGSRALLERLSITGGLVTVTIEPNSFETLRKLKFLSLRDNGLRELKRNQFKGLVELESLDVSFNSIDKVEAIHFADLTKLVRCNVSRNSIASLPRGAFARNTLLQVLDLSGNRLTKLDGNALKGLRMLARLHLNDNQIVDVERATFSSVARIKTINMARNKLRKVDYQMFNDLRLIELIDLSENSIVLVEKLAFKSLYLVNINLSANNISIVEKGAFEMCVNITKLDLSANRLTTLAGDAFDENTYAMELQLSDNRFEDLSLVPLANMTGLKVLNVTRNKLKTVPKNTFPKLYELHTIDLSDNAIEQIASEVFQPLIGLRYLYLNDNSLQQLKSRTFGKIFTLLELHLQRNRISRIKTDAFVDLISLRILKLNDNALEEFFQISISLSELDLRNNSLTYLAPGKIWPSMNTLTWLDLSLNYFEDSLEKGAFANLLVLQRLNLAGNRISRVPRDSLEDFSSLRYIDMSANLLTELEPSAFGSLPVLFELNLSDNNISALHKAAFAKVPQLRKITLAGNAISNLSREMFKELYILEELDLSANVLTALTDVVENDDIISSGTRSSSGRGSVLEDCWSLKKLNVSRNALSSLNKNSFPTRSPLQTVDLSGNQLYSFSDRPFQSLKYVRHLNLSENVLEEIPSNLLENLTDLIALDLSGNSLTALNLNVLPLTNSSSNLTHLYARNNRINTLKFKYNGTTAVFSNLQTIDLRDNSLTSIYDPFVELLSSSSSSNNATRILYAGNPVVCSCNIRLLRRWLLIRRLQQIDINDDDWSGFTCYDFQTETNRTVVETNEQDIWCDSVTLRSSPDRYNMPSDISFRSASSEGNRIGVSWYVAEGTDDVADFVLEILDNSRTIYRKDVSYAVRKEFVNRRDVTNNARLCLLTKTSLGVLRNRTENQCRFLNTLLHNRALSSYYYYSGYLIFFSISIAILFVQIWNGCMF